MSAIRPIPKFYLGFSEEKNGEVYAYSYMPVVRHFHVLITTIIECSFVFRPHSMQNFDVL